MKNIKSIVALSLLTSTILFAGCCGNVCPKDKIAECCGECPKNQTTTMAQNTPYTKKYTNKDYYKDGVFQADVAYKAYGDMLNHYGYELTDFIKDNLWITDFNLGDFENVGMAGFFWVNDADANYFGHEIFLLPSQMIVEHKHMPTEFAAKMESWVVKNGFCYNFGIGEASVNAPATPESQKGHILSKSFISQNVNEIVHLKEIETPHFLMAGPNGAIVLELASYHDGSGLRFTNPNAVFTSSMVNDL